jgi:hypothetical protein
LIYTLDGADAASFGLSRNNGRLRTMAAPDGETGSSYAVEVTAPGPSGAAVSIPVTIRGADEDGPAQIAGSGAVAFADAARAIAKAAM